MKNYPIILLGISFISSISLLNAQTINTTNAQTKTNEKVGINTTIPTRTLTIENSSNNAGKPALRLVGTPKYSENINYKMDADLVGNTATTAYTDYRPLMIDKNGDVYKGVPITSTVSLLTITVSNVEGDWISNFDTGIDYNKYAMAIMSYSFRPGNGGDYDILVMSDNNPNVVYGGKTLSRVAAPVVKLQNKNGNWGIYADYPATSSVRTPFNGSTQYGTIVNGTWTFTLIIGKRDLVNFMELEFNQNGYNSGVGTSNSTYRANLESVLKKLD